MSRIGREPITIPAGVDVTIADGNVVTVKGKLGTLTETFSSLMTIKKDGAVITVSRPNDENQTRALHGLTRALLNNMVNGVSQGYSKTLKIEGVGYRAAKSGKTLNLSLGYSHPVNMDEHDGITFEVPDANTIVVKGADKQLVGAVAAQVRGKRPPEPYHGKGVRYEGEVVRRKAGKTGK